VARRQGVKYVFFFNFVCSFNAHSNLSFKHMTVENTDATLHGGR